MRKNFIDNLRWMDVLLLIPYHAAQAFDTWGEMNYIYFWPNRAISSFIVFFSPFFMPLLFLLAGMNTRYSLNKRTYGQYIVERIKRLIIPFLFGTLVFCPVLAYIGDVSNYSYSGSIFDHYAVFFTKWTDFTGYDGGFNVGQFWFLLFLFLISLGSVGIIALSNKIFKNQEKAGDIPFWGLCLFIIPLPLFYNVLSVGGNSFSNYLYIFLVGYYIMSYDIVIEKAEKYRFISLTIGLAASIAYVFLITWSEKDYWILNMIARAFAEWFMMLALIGIGKNKLDNKNRFSEYMSQRSFPYFSLHFMWIVLIQYWFAGTLGGNAALLYFVPIICAFAATFICSEICLRIPVLCFLMGTKSIKPRKI